MSRLKQRLEDNEIFFKTISATLLSIMAIIISIVQIQVSRDSIKLTRAQFVLSKSEQMPRFTIRVSGNQGITIDSLDNDLIGILNKGGFARGINCVVATYLDIECIASDDSLTVRIPIDEYYNKIRFKDLPVGQVVSVESQNSVIRVRKLQQELNDLLKNRGYQLSLHVQRYIRLYFQDVFGQAHTEYYYASPIFGEISMNQHEGEQLLSTFHNSVKNGESYRLDQISSDKIYPNVISVKIKSDVLKPLNK